MLRAAQAEHGLLLRVSDPERAMRAFARAREEHESAEGTEGEGEGFAPMLPPVRFQVLEGHPEGNLAVLRVISGG